MKNILKWFTVFFIVMVLATGLEMAKLSLFRPPNIERIEDHEKISGSQPSQNDPGPEKYAPFGPPPAGMEWAFALADLIDLLVYALILLPLFYGAYLLDKRTLHLPRFNIATTSIISSFKPNERSSAERDQVSTQQGDYLVSDSHMLDQLL